MCLIKILWNAMRREDKTEIKPDALWNSECLFRDARQFEMKSRRLQFTLINLASAVRLSVAYIVENIVTVKRMNHTIIINYIDLVFYLFGIINFSMNIFNDFRHFSNFPSVAYNFEYFIWYTCALLYFPSSSSKKFWNIINSTNVEKNKVDRRM